LAKTWNPSSVVGRQPSASSHPSFGIGDVAFAGGKGAASESRFLWAAPLRNDIALRGSARRPTADDGLANDVRRTTNDGFSGWYD